MSNTYNNAPQVKLSDYIPADRFRTILAESRHMGGGITEIPAEIQISKEFARKLSFNVPWDGLIYGFVRRKKELEAEVMEEIERIYIQDWDDRFLLLFENHENHEEKPFFVTPEEVIELLENCRRAPSQK